MTKIYPSNAAFVADGIVITETDSGCLRALLAKQAGLQQPFPAIYGDVGAVHEDNVQAALLDDPQTTAVLKEYPVKHELANNGLLSGRVDFIRFNVDGTITPIECKSTISKNTRLSVIRKGKLKLNHLAQIACYMLLLKQQKAEVHVGYYEATEGGFICTESRVFKVSCDDEGQLSVDGGDPFWSISSLVDWLNHRVRALQEGADFPEKPRSFDDGWSTPCRMCCYKSVCDNNPVDTEEFISACKEVVPVVRTPEATQYKPKKKIKSADELALDDDF